jgi:hypothetical protein
MYSFNYNFEKIRNQQYEILSRIMSHCGSTMLSARELAENMNGTQTGLWVLENSPVVDTDFDEKAEWGCQPANSEVCDWWFQAVTPGGVVFCINIEKDGVIDLVVEFGRDSQYLCSCMLAEILPHDFEGAGALLRDCLEGCDLNW